ncbi:hypothetical protein AC244_02285 [Ensifer adhaerens]|uniref:Uncharacterized protein n=1 Tax=Ensifer adhaerens TaxID=106592 RepID=A0A0L8C6G6_ENSAD|nr:hypothetical protein AC244_02285 [Ensifer adhaerens]
MRGDLLQKDADQPSSSSWMALAPAMRGSLPAMVAISLRRICRIQSCRGLLVVRLMIIKITR